MPTTSHEWQGVAQHFLMRWNFPHCLGSMDGKHIQIVAPEHSGSMFFNYKGFHSIVVLAVADANYNFIYLDVGCQGRISDGGVFNYTSLYEKMNRGTLGLPQPATLPGREIPVPYVFVADDAFPLSQNLMKPYPGHTPGLHSPGRIFNYRLSRARRIIENVFGIWSAKFRVLLKPIALHPNKVETVALACAYLHNFLRRDATSRNGYTPAGSFDAEDCDGNLIYGSWRSQVEQSQQLIRLQNTPRRTQDEAQTIRNEFRDYFISEEGSVPWQNDMI